MSLVCSAKATGTMNVWTENPSFAVEATELQSENVEESGFYTIKIFENQVCTFTLHIGLFSATSIFDLKIQI